MKTITFKELIELIEKNEQPKSIKYFEEVYEWKNYDYRDESGYQINRYYTLASLINATFQIPTEPLLTDEEKAYLKAVIEPFKDEMGYIIKTHSELKIMGEYDEYIVKFALLDSEYTKLEQHEKYTLKDLDLE